MDVTLDSRTMTAVTLKVETLAAVRRLCAAMSRMFSTKMNASSVCDTSESLLSLTVTMNEKKRFANPQSL